MRITVKFLTQSQNYLAAIHCDQGTFEARGSSQEEAIGNVLLRHKEYIMPSVEVEVLSDSW